MREKWNMQPSKLVSNKERIQNFVFLSYSVIFNYFFEKVGNDKKQILVDFLAEWIMKEKLAAFSTLIIEVPIEN
jgi:hypothetical protein